MSSEYPQGENSANAPEVPYQMPTLWLRRSIGCTPYRGSVSNTDRCLLGGFNTHFTGSPLFAEATVSCHPACTSVMTTTLRLQRSSCPLLALFNPKTNRFPDCTAWRWRTLRSYLCIYISYLSIVAIQLKRRGNGRGWAYG